MNSTSSIITIGRQYGSGGRQIGQEVAKYFGIKCYDKELLNMQQMKVESAKNFLRIMMKDQLTAFYILWLWIPTHLVILLQDLQICL